MALETVRLSEMQRDQLQRVKRATGIGNWNILCRWSLSLSLAEEAEPTPVPHGIDSGVEMTWKVFGGPYSDVYRALIMAKLSKSGQEGDEDNFADYFRRHLHRGIGILNALIAGKSVDEMGLLAIGNYSPK